MSITLDVNAFLNKDVCEAGYDDMAMEKEMETNIFDEIEHLLKFNKNLEYGEAMDNEPVDKEEEPPQKKHEELKQPETLPLDFLNTHSDDFLLTSDSQSLLGEDTLLFSVEQDKLLPISSRFMVPGIYKRIEGVAPNDCKRRECQKSNVFISELEKHGRIVKQKDFQSLYIMADDCKDQLPLRKVLLLESMESEEEEEEVNVGPVEKTEDKREEKKDKIPKEWDALNRLAYDILKLTNRDHIVIDRKKNEIVRTQFETQQKTIYRFLAPEMLGLKPSTGQETKIINLEEDSRDVMKQTFKNKLGRPKKRLKEELNKKNSNKINKNLEKPKKSFTDNKLPTNINNNLRTRSGRLIKTTIPVVEKQSKDMELPIPTSPTESTTNLLNDLKDADYHGPKLDNIAATNDFIQPKEAPNDLVQSPSKRKVPPEAICPTCNKIFLGRRLQRHFAQHPEHMKVPTNSPTADILPNPTVNSENITNPLTEDMSLFRFLILKLQKSQNLNEDQKADLFLNELNDLIEQLQLRSSRLVRNTSGLHFVNQRCSKLLGIPEGQYALDLSAIALPVDPDLSVQYENSHTHHHHHHSQPNNISSRSLDYTQLSITLDDTLTDEAAQKLNLSAGGKLLPPSEESLLRAVDDLVQTDLNKLHKSSLLHHQPPVHTNNLSSASSLSSTGTVVPHIDHASDNAVEAVNMKETSSNVNPSENPLLDLSVDFFQFNN